MTKVIRCRDLGFECDGVLKGESEEEVLAMAAEHAKDAHDISDMSDEMFHKVKSIIREEPS